jgi:hypothetical protein
LHARSVEFDMFAHARCSIGVIPAGYHCRHLGTVNGIRIHSGRNGETSRQVRT